MIVRFLTAGFDRVRSTLLRWQRKTADFTPAFELARERFLAAEREQFDTEGAYGSGVGWQPLSPAYAAWKMINYPGAGILHASGTLERSLTEGPQVVEYTPHSATFGTAVPYAGFHQEGTDQMPARPPVVLPLSEQEEWVKIMEAHVVGAVAEAGDGLKW